MAGPTPPPATAAVGTELPEWRQPITHELVAAYALASGDHNPIHLDPDFARAAGLGGTIAHGMLSMGILAAYVGAWAGSAAAVVDLRCRFAGMVRPGDTLVCRGRVASRDSKAGTVTLELEATTESGTRALNHAGAVVRVPTGEED